MENISRWINMKISDYILDGNLLGIWVALLLGVGYLLITKIDLKHRRVLPKLIIAVLLFGIPTLLTYYNYSLPRILISSFTVFPIVILLFISIRWLLPHESILLFWLKKKKFSQHLRAGENLEKKFFRYFFSTPGKIKFLSELLTYYSRYHLSKLIHHCILSYSRLPLFESEKDAFDFNRGLSYIQMGATSKVEQILDGASDSFKQTSEHFFLLAHVVKCKGLLDEEREYLERALHLQDYDGSLKCQLYNNIAVNAHARGNHTDTVHFYSKATEFLSKHPSFNTKHIVIPNMIDIYLLDGEISKAESLFEDYRKMIDFSNIDDVLMWDNYRLTYYRQRGDLNNLKKVYDDGTAQLSARLTHEECLAFQINELRMRWNNRIEWEKPLGNVCQHLDEYFALPFPESFIAAKELCFIMKGLDEQQNSLYDSGIVKKLIAFLRKSAPELDSHLRSLPDEFVNERFNLTKDKAWLLQVLFDPHEQNDNDYTIMLDKKIILLNDLVDIQQQAGNAVNALEARLGIPDEVISQVFSPFTAGFFNRPQFFDYRRKCLDLSKKQMDIVYNELARFGRDISILTFKLRLAYYFMFFKEIDRAYPLYKDFEDSGISINHFADWIRGYHDKLQSAFIALNILGQRAPLKNF
jgi:hypothetical protein